MSHQGVPDSQYVFWYNLRTGQVQTNYDKDQGKDLMGPYATAEEARHALQRAAERTEEWDEEDRRWREGDDAPPQ